MLLMGEDVATAGGVFKTNEGLPEQFGPERVRNTPICENGFLGVALGMAVTGLRPVVEIMFSDFLPTGGDAIVNELPKFRFMSGGQCNVPVTVRSIGGATGRFGTQHSATGESWYMGLPGLKVADGRHARLGVRRCCGLRSATTTRCSSSSTRASTAGRARSRAARRASPRSGEAPSCAAGSDVTIVLDAADGRPLARGRRARSPPRGSTPRSSSCAGCGRSTTTRSRRASARPGGC